MRIGVDLGGTRIEAVALGDEGEILARTLATVIDVVDPDVIVPGGGLSNLDRLYRAPPEKLPASDRLDTAVLPPRHGASGGAREAAWLWRPGEAELAGYGTGP